MRVDEQRERDLAQFDSLAEKLARAPGVPRIVREYLG
jgi:hypothetical protein